MVQVYLGGLASKFGAFRTAVCTRENTPSFFDLQSMLLVEENHAGASTSTQTDNKMLYMKGDRPRGHGGGVEAMRTGKGNPPRNAGIVARKATRRVSAGRSALIRIEPGPDPVLDISTKAADNDCTTPKDPEKPEKGLPS